MKANTVLTANSTATQKTAQQKRLEAIRAKDTRTEAQKAEAEAKKKAEAEAEAKKAQLIAEAQKKAEAQKEAQQKKNEERAKRVDALKKAEAEKKAKADTKKEAEKKAEAKKAEAKKKAKTTFDMIEAEAVKLASFITIQNNASHSYARICFTDTYKKDNYKLLKDFAIYYDKSNLFTISIADNLLDCKMFKATHERIADKIKELKFSIEADKLHNTLFELVAQRIAQTDKAINVSSIKAIKTKAEKQSKSRAKAK